MADGRSDLRDNSVAIGTEGWPTVKQADETDRLRNYADFVALWCFRESKLSDTERLSAIKYHPVTKAAHGGYLAAASSPPAQSGAGEARKITGLAAIAAVIRSWLDWDRAHRDKEFLTTDGDTAIMSLPVPFWPSHACFENWISTMIESDNRIATLTAEMSGADDGWQPIETAPNNLRILVEKSIDANGPDEIAMAWLDRGDGKFWYSPQGGMLNWAPQRWRHLPE